MGSSSLTRIEPRPLRCRCRGLVTGIPEQLPAFVFSKGYLLPQIKLPSKLNYPIEFSSVKFTDFLGYCGGRGLFFVFDFSVCFVSLFKGNLCSVVIWLDFVSVLFSLFMIYAL